MVLLSAMPSAAETVRFSLQPVPYEVELPSTIVARLSAGELTGPWADETRAAGAAASVLVQYQPAEGGKSVLMSVYYFPADRFDAAQNPNEPPPFGKEVIRSGGMVLSVAGPHDTIFDPETDDGRNVVAAAGLIYQPENYTPRP